MTDSQVMFEALLVAGIMAAPKNPTLELLEPKPTQETVEVVKPVEPTLEEKIKTNYFKCDESTQYIRADNAECLAKPVVVAPSTQTTVKTPVRGSHSGNSAGNTYQAGQCVWFIKNMRPEIPNSWGNATSWLANAQADGWLTGSEPRVGAVGWTYGHVVLITAVNGDGTVSYTDMNGRWVPYEIGYGTKSSSYYSYIY